MDQATIDQIRQRLVDEANDLKAQLHDMGIDPKTGSPDDVVFEQGFADSAQATAEKARLLSIADGLMEILGEIRGALDRIEKGTYGTCQRCGNEIPPERLEARPYASLCMTCKQQSE